MNTKLILYSYRRCPFAIRVRMALHEKGLEFTTIEEDLKNFSPTLRALHPEAKVPLLVHGDKVVYESAVITEYLDESFPVPPLMPSTPNERAEVRLWTHWCNHSFKPHIDHYKYGESRADANLVKQAPNALGKDLAKLQARLAKHTWLVGDQLSLADIHVFPFFRQLLKTTPPLPGLENFANVQDWFGRICQRDSLERTLAKT